MSTLPRRRLRRKRTQPPSAFHSRLRQRRFEALEARRLLAIDTWTNSGGGKWDNPPNWSTGVVPGSGDDAVINTAAAATITIQSSDSIQVRSVSTASGDTLSFTGGSLTVTAGASSLSGALSMTGGQLTANGAGVQLTANGSTTASDASLSVQGGATLSLPQLTSFANPNGPAIFVATGLGSTLDLSALTTLSASLNQGGLTIQANAGALINLSRLATIQRNAVVIGVAGSGSKIDLTALTKFSVVGGQFNVTNSATVLAPNLPGFNGVDVSLDGSGNVATSQWTTLTAGGLTLSGGSLTLPALTDIDGSFLQAQTGGSLSLPALTSSAPNSFSAANQGSKLDLPALKTVGASQTQVSFQATAGAVIDVPKPATIQRPSTILADGAGSEIDLSSLTDLLGGTFAVTNSATILAPNLPGFNAVRVTLDGSANIATSQWTTLTGGSLTINSGSVTLTGLADIDNSSLSVKGGGSLSLPALTSFANPNGGASFVAAGLGSTLGVLQGEDRVVRGGKSEVGDEEDFGHRCVPRRP